MPRRRPIRLLLCVPLLVVMAFWSFSFGRYNSWEFFLGRTRGRFASYDGVLRLTFGHHGVTVAYWVVWVAVAIVTIFVHSRFRQPTNPGIRRLK